MEVVRGEVGAMRAVVVGTGGRGNAGTLCTHDNGLKKFSFKWLPAPTDATKGGPRGTCSIKIALQSCVGRGSFLVHDKWAATMRATRELGLRAAPPVNHSKGFCEVSGG